VFLILVISVKFIVSIISLDDEVFGWLFFDWISINDSGGSVNYSQVMPFLKCLSG